MHIVALDIGTQSVRAALLTKNGDILGIHQIQHPLDAPHPNWAQQNPDEWWDHSCEALRAVLRETRVDRTSIAVVAVCGQMHGPVGVDIEGKTTTPWVQLWCDKRCEPQCREMLLRHPADELQRLTGNPVGPAWTAIKARWIKDNDPEAYERTRWFLVPKDFINYRLTGVAAADPSEASCSYLYDCNTNAYSPRLAECVGVDLLKFAPIHPSHEVIGSVTETAARLTGLPAGTPVIAGGGDFPVSMLGFGIVGEGVTADVTGTSTLVAAHTKSPLIDPCIQNLRHVVDGWIPFTILDCGGLSQKWIKDVADSLRTQPASYAELEELARKAPPGSEGLYFYPYMMGERRSENIAARGGWFGLRLDHEAPHLIRSVLEGVALTMGKDIAAFRAQGHPHERLLSVGGGTRNELWNEIKASVLQTPLELSEEPEAGLKGCAILGAAGVGLIGDPVQTALERRQKSRVVQPDLALASAYAAAQKEYSRIYDHMLGFWSN